MPETPRSTANPRCSMSPLSRRDDSTSSKPISASAWIARDAVSRSSVAASRSRRGSTCAGRARWSWSSPSPCCWPADEDVADHVSNEISQLLGRDVLEQVPGEHQPAHDRAHGGDHAHRSRSGTAGSENTRRNSSSMSWFASSCSSAWWSRNAELLRWCIRMRRRFSKISSISPSSSCAHASRLAGRFAEALHRATSDFVQAHVQGQQDLVLALEVVVDRCFRESELVGDLAQRCLVEALLDEEVHRDVEDAIACAHRLLERSSGARRRGRRRGRARPLGVRVLRGTSFIILDGR